MDKAIRVTDKAIRVTDKGMDRVARLAQVMKVFENYTKLLTKQSSLNLKLIKPSEKSKNGLLN
jgi:hypothetical protein